MAQPPPPSPPPNAAPSVRRFYNASLTPVYNSCPVEVRRATPATARKPHHFDRAFAAKCDDDASGFLQRDRRPRHATAPSATQLRTLAQPFRRALPDWQPSLPEAMEDDDDAGEDAAPAAKKCRKRARVGAYRAYRVRMIPTAEQKRELKRCFAAARHAYNWFVNRVEEHGDAPNEFARKKEYRASDRPEWTEGVASKIVAGGIADAAEAYKSNFAKRKLHPGQHGAFKVKYRSHRKTLTESIHIDGDGDGATKQSPLLAFRPLPFANNPALRSECAAFFGNNLSGLGEKYWDEETPEECAERLARRRETGRRIDKRKPQWRTPKGADGIRLQDKPHVIARLLAEGRNGDGMGVVNGCKIHWDKRKDSFHLLYVYELPPLADPDPSFETKRVVATDPGVRAFATWYAPSTGNHGELFKGGEGKIQHRCALIDYYASQCAHRGQHYTAVAPTQPHAPAAAATLPADQAHVCARAVPAPRLRVPGPLRRRQPPAAPPRGRHRTHARHRQNGAARRSCLRLQDRARHAHVVAWIVCATPLLRGVPARGTARHR